MARIGVVGEMPVAAKLSDGRSRQRICVTSGPIRVVFCIMLTGALMTLNRAARSAPRLTFEL